MPVRRYLNRTDPQLRSAADCQASATGDDGERALASVAFVPLAGDATVDRGAGVQAGLPLAVAAYLGRLEAGHAGAGLRVQAVRPLLAADVGGVEMSRVSPR